MVREVDLVRYLPEFLKAYKELIETLEAENPEFNLIWEAADRVLNNLFIETADEYGISRLESIMGILPYEGDSLEERRTVVRTKWLYSVPYTFRLLLEKLAAICDGMDYEVEYEFEKDYWLWINTHVESHGQLTEVGKLLEMMVPANINYQTLNTLLGSTEGDLYFAGSVAALDYGTVTGDFTET